MQILEEEKCPQCGVPTWHAFSENAEIEFEIEHIDCFSCAAKEEADKKEKKKTPGRTTHARPVHIDGEDLPTRADFYQELYEKSQKKKSEEDEE